jgi:hypothetical protein
VVGVDRLGRRVIARQPNSAHIRRGLGGD